MFEMDCDAMDSGLSQTWEMGSVTGHKLLWTSWEKASASQEADTTIVWKGKVWRHVPTGHFHAKNTKNSEWALPYCLAEKGYRNLWPHRHCSKGMDCAIGVRIKGIKRLKENGISDREDSFHHESTLNTCEANWAQSCLIIIEVQYFSDTLYFSCLLFHSQTKGTNTLG